MSYGMNPFDAWANNAGGSSSVPSVFGALPYPNDPAYANMVDFFFTSFNPNILNCTVIGPSNRPYYTIASNGQMSGYTAIKNGAGKDVSLIEWQSRPMIEIRDVLPKQYIRSWLALNSDKSSRTMTVRGMQYTWAPRDRAINLYAAGARQPILLARVTRNNGGLTLSITKDAMNTPGLLDATISATFLLQCGRNID